MQITPSAAVGSALTPSQPGVNVAYWIPKNGAAPSYIDSVTPLTSLVFDGDGNHGIKDAIQGARLFALECGSAVGVFRNDATDTWSISMLFERTAQYPDASPFDVTKQSLRKGSYRLSEAGAFAADRLQAIVGFERDVRFA